MNDIFDVKSGRAYFFEFTNFRGETSFRHVIARGLRWGSTPWHKDTQFFFDGFDLDKQEVRSFPISGINARAFRWFTDEELDVFLTMKVQDAVSEALSKMPQPEPEL